MKDLNTKLDDSVKDKLEKVSKESGVIIKKIVEIALLDYFKKYKK